VGLVLEGLEMSSESNVSFGEAEARRGSRVSVQSERASAMLVPEAFLYLWMTSVYTMFTYVLIISWASSGLRYSQELPGWVARLQSCLCLIC
jgi:hypothetical protein